MSRWMERVGFSGVKGIALVMVFSLGLFGCGGGGGDDEITPTSGAVDAQPTVGDSTESNATPDGAVNDGSAATPQNTDLSTVGSMGTPVENDETPVSDEAATPGASPAADGAGTDVGDASEESPGEPSTPQSDDSTAGGNAQDPANEVLAGDGTTGATPSSAAGETAEEPADEDIASSDAGTPAASGEPAVVDSCDPDVVPPFTGDVTTFVLVADLNFRAGPGSNCDLIGAGPLGEFSQVEVVSGVVIREGEEDIEWVQIQVGDDTGWVASEFLEPSE